MLYHAALGAYKKLRKKQQFEVSLDYLREFDFEPVATTDECFVKYDVPTTFTICGKTVIVENEHLAARKAAGSAIFVVLPRLQRRRNQ